MTAGVEDNGDTDTPDVTREDVLKADETSE